MVLVGEIRDFETAEIAVRAAQTGHLVLSTLHTNDSLSAVTRLIEMRIEPYLIASSLVCSISQRLARRICRHCAEADLAIAEGVRTEMAAALAIPPEQVQAWKGRGCVECNQKGHRGRVAIYEFFLLNEEISDLIRPGLRTAELRHTARRFGWRLLREAAWAKVQHGLIPIAEQERWTRLIDLESWPTRPRPRRPEEAASMAHPTGETNPWLMLPFGLLLGAIALGPLISPAAWARHYARIALGLGAITVGYYVLGLHDLPRVVRTTLDYTGFIFLIGALYVVCGGIHLQTPGEATPAGNTLFLLTGALAANLLGTTGASMVLIRPWIQMNRRRVTAHHIVFFIFIVSNVGGCLTPVGDPPLFLGYLKGVPFWWVAQRCWPLWAMAVRFLLTVFFVLDTLDHRRTPARVRTEPTMLCEGWRVEGLGNLCWLLVVLGAVFLEHPPFLRELLLAGAAAGSYGTTKKVVHEANHFDFHPIREVAILFAGIFATMMPALDWLQVHAGQIGTPTPGAVFWASGLLSSVLDNAPTYLGFLSALFGAAVSPDLVDQVQALIASHGVGPHSGPAWNAYTALQHWHSAAVASGSVGPDEIRIACLLGARNLSACLAALSVGAVFFGANTYIGNGPNFMVKSIADQQNVPTPGFLGFILKYTLPCMVPMLVLVWLVFFRK